ncbi:MAG: hypothetical protein JRH11_18875 [Deltaproteobacteria bacterium]|nr:hypothetical protein [Deltaproteobacteria bacterium]
MMTRHAPSNFGLLFISAALFALLLASGCGDDTPMPDGGGPHIEIGTGPIGEYTPVADGDTALLVRGSQGGQHVWVGLRAWNLVTSPALIQLRLEGESDGEMLSIPFQVRLTFSDTLPPDADYTQLSGLSLVVIDPEVAFSQPVTIRARVVENRTGGLVAETAVTGLTVEWDPDTPLPGGDAGPNDGDASLDGGPADGAVPDAGDGGAGDAAPDDASAGDAGAADAGDGS